MIATLPKTYYNKNHEKQHSKEKLMKKIKKLTSLLFCCLFLYLLAFPGQVQAASLTPTAQDNLSVKLRRSSDLISISNGYMRVFRKTNSVGIEYYDNSLQITDKREIPMELPLWGGFYAGSDGYYLVEGQNTKLESQRCGFHYKQSGFIWRRGSLSIRLRMCGNDRNQRNSLYCNRS